MVARGQGEMGEEDRSCENFARGFVLGEGFWEDNIWKNIKILVFILFIYLAF